MKKDFVKHICALILFGFNGIVAGNIALSSYEIVFMRTLIGSLLLLAVFLAGKGHFTFYKNKKHFGFLIISGIAMGASWMFLYEAYTQIGIANASLAYYCGPVIIMALSPLLFREKLTAVKILCFIAVLCGIVLINIKALSSGKSTWGIFCGIMSAATYSVMVIFSKKSKSIKGLENPTLQLIISFLTVAVFVGLKQGLAINASASDWPFILLLGLLNTGAGCYLYFSSLNTLPVQTVAVCGYTEPLCAVLFSALIMHENMGAVQITGTALIIGGAVLAELSGSNIKLKKHQSSTAAKSLK